MNVCIIPARGGSKRIPKKNIRNFNGLPIIAWSIKAAIESKIFDYVIVSTDDLEIQNIAKDFGALAPFLRPDKISNDFATTTDVMKHAVEWTFKNGINTDLACCLYATSPLIQVSDMLEAYKIFKAKKWSYVFSVTEFSVPIFRSIKIMDEGGVKMHYPEYFNTRSQDLPNSYHDAGMFYMGTSEAWSKELKIFDEHSYPYLIPNHRVQDIDTLDDWKRAELLSKILATK